MTLQERDSIIRHSKKIISFHPTCHRSRIEAYIIVSLDFGAGLIGWKPVKHGTHASRHAILSKLQTDFWSWTTFLVKVSGVQRALTEIL